MPLANDVIDALQAATIARLTPLLATIDARVVPIDQESATVVDASESALAGQGLRVLVLAPELTESAPAMSARLGIYVEEIVRVNRGLGGTGISANRWAREIVADLMGWAPAEEWSRVHKLALAQAEAGEESLAWLVSGETATNITTA